MFETELKFQVPAPRWAALHKAVATTTAVKTRLQAMYVETPGHDLAAAGLALRLRKEGRVWVQTLKGRGDGLMQRLEHEVRLPPLPARSGLPQVDPARHDGTPAGQALQRVLAAAREAGRSDTLQVLYRTDIQRLHRRVRHGGAVVEIALDQGAIHAGADTAAPLMLPVAEIEFELISGPPQALAALAARWAARFDLWWDVRTKSERGFRLALGLARVPATRAQPQVLPAGGLAPALASMLQAALAQALPNLAELAGAPADTPAAPEHLHQLRVALRRLRTALVLLGDWAPEPAAALTLETRWREVFNALGAARDADVLASTWMPRLQAAGAPALSGPPAQNAGDVTALLREHRVTVLLLDTLAFSLDLSQPAAPPAPGAETPEAAPGPASARAVLRRAWRRAWADARKFDEAPVEQQHRARKRLKRLRYVLEFLTPWLPARSLRRYQRALRRALEALGEHNDLQTARAHFAGQTPTDPQAWFAVGWLAAQDGPSRERAVQALARLKARKRPWLKR